MSDASSSRSSSPVTEGAERWRASLPPRESFSDAEGANQDGEWVYCIVGEEVDCRGIVWYEVRWDDWSRADGTKTTWNDGHSISTTSWNAMQRRVRRDNAAESCAIEIPTTTDFHNSETRLREQAYAEKTKRVKKEKEPSFMDEMAKNLARHQQYVHPSRGTRLAAPRASTRQQTEHSLAASSSSSTLVSVRSASKLSARSSTTLISRTAAPPPPPSMSSSVSSASALSFGAYKMESNTPETISKKKISVASISSRTAATPPPSFSSASASVSSFGVHKMASKTPGPALQDKISVISLKQEEEEDGDEEEEEEAASDDDEQKQDIRQTVVSPGKRRRIVLSDSDSDSDCFPDWATDDLNIGASCPAPSVPSSSVERARPVVEIPGIRNRRVLAIASELLAADTQNLTDMRRVTLQTEWTIHALKAGAAPIQFCNDVDDEAIPHLDPNFCYLECKYNFAPGIMKPPDEFLINCSCTRCMDASQCNCQDASDLLDDNENPVFAYTEAGLFAFNVLKGTEVIECNKLCTCTIYQCQNRVSQRRRDVPVEIFKTLKRGWGVRPMVDVKRGKVLGIYTGLVMRRDDAVALPDELTTYCFNLDGDEIEGGESIHDKFTVDSRLYGNWTRFINHSCAPNLQVYLVVHDTPPSSGMPYIAFVATHDIPARTEFTFEYDPRAAEQSLLAKAKKKGKQRQAVAPEGAVPCHCGARGCRGFLTV